MRPFLLRLTVFAAIQLAILVAVFVAFRPSPQHFLAATIDKHRLLDTTPSPRLVVAGGSNLALGLECDSLATHVPLHPLNMAIHAGLGLGFTLSEIREGLRRGDVVLLSIEYEQFGFKTQPEVLLRLIQARPASLAYVPLDYWPSLLDHGLSYFGNVVRGATERVRGIPEPFKKGPYRRDAFNAYGDDTLRAERGKNPPVRVPLFPEAQVPRGFAGSIATLNRFHADCERRGVRVYFTHGVIPETRWSLHQAQFATAESLVALRLTIPRLERIEDVIYPDRNFFDTEYHLNREGVAERSHWLALDLAARLAADGVTPPGGGAATPPSTPR